MHLNWLITVVILLIPGESVIEGSSIAGAKDAFSLELKHLHQEVFQSTKNLYLNNIEITTAL